MNFWFKDFVIIDSNANGLVEHDEVHLLSINELEKIFDGEAPGTVSENVCKLFYTFFAIGNMQHVVKYLK